MRHLQDYLASNSSIKNFMTSPCVWVGCVASFSNDGRAQVHLQKAVGGLVGLIVAMLLEAALLILRTGFASEEGPLGPGSATSPKPQRRQQLQQLPQTHAEGKDGRPAPVQDEQSPFPANRQSPSSETRLHTAGVRSDATLTQAPKRRGGFKVDPFGNIVAAQVAPAAPPGTIDVTAAGDARELQKTGADGAAAGTAGELKKTA